MHIPLNIFVSYEFLILSPSLRMKLVDEAPKQQQAAAPAVRFNGVNNGNGQQVQTKKKKKIVGTTKEDNDLLPKQLPINISDQRPQQWSQ